MHEKIGVFIDKTERRWLRDKPGRPPDKSASRERNRVSDHLLPACTYTNGADTNEKIPSVVRVPSKQLQRPEGPRYLATIKIK